MRALWVTQVFPRHRADPFGSFLLRLARAMAPHGVDVTVVAPGDEGVPSREDLDGVHVERFDVASRGASGLAYRGEMHRAALRRPLAMLRFADVFRAATDRAIRDHRPDVVHAHWWIPTAWVIRGVLTNARVAWVVSLHGTDVRLVRTLPPLAAVAGRVLRSADAVLPVSDALDREVAKWGVRAESREVLPMPADGDLFQPSSQTVAAPDAMPRFVLVARLTRQKRVHDALAAVHALARSGVRVRLEVVGDGPERSALEARSARFGLSDVVTFRGMLPLEELPTIYRGSWALLMPAEREGYGLTIVEAALCGIPAIAARSGGPEELVQHERTGLLVPVGDVDALAAAMTRIASDPAQAKRWGDEARRAATARTAEPLAGRLAAVYRRVAARVTDTKL